MREKNVQYMYARRRREKCWKIKDQNSCSAKDLWLKFSIVFNIVSRLEQETKWYYWKQLLYASTAILIQNKKEKKIFNMLLGHVMNSLSCGNYYVKEKSRKKLFKFKYPDNYRKIHFISNRSGSYSKYSRISHDWSDAKYIAQEIFSSHLHSRYHKCGVEFYYHSNKTVNAGFDSLW